MPMTEAEKIRRAVLAITAENPTIEFDANVLAARVRERLPEVELTQFDVLKALAFLEGLWLLKRKESSLGGSEKWIITSQGVLFHERNG